MNVQLHHIRGHKNLPYLNDEELFDEYLDEIEDERQWHFKEEDLRSRNMQKIQKYFNKRTKATSK